MEVQVRVVKFLSNSRAMMKGDPTTTRTIILQLEHNKLYLASIFVIIPHYLHIKEKLIILPSA